MTLLIMIVMSIIVSQTEICTALCQQMFPCDHKENNIIICVHLKDAITRMTEKFYKNC